MNKHGANILDSFEAVGDGIQGFRIIRPEKDSNRVMAFLYQIQIQTWPKEDLSELVFALGRVGELAEETIHR